MKRYLMICMVFMAGYGTALGQEHQHKMDANGQSIHDEANMPMLNGNDTTDEEVEALRELFQNHAEITRQVTHLPNGIETITETKDEALRPYLMSHVSDMILRIEEDRDPEVPIQSKTLDGIFVGHEKISTTIEPTVFGVKIVQTSDDPEMVKLLQTHAGEIDDMVARGMQAVHERMMKEMGM